MNKKALIEGVKELGRIMFFAALTAASGWLASKLAGFDPTSVYYVVGTVLLRVFDRYVHENKDVPANGLAPF